MKDSKLKNKISGFKIDEHLSDYLKTSYAQRLAWLEEAVKMQQLVNPRRVK